MIFRGFFCGGTQARSGFLDYCYSMIATELKKLTPAVRAAWLSFHSPLVNWVAGQDVFCLHCDGVWKAEDVACDQAGEPTCPACRDCGPLGFGSLPWWRADLVIETDEAPYYEWASEAVAAEPGNPRKLPAPNEVRRLRRW
jgi:hypothetical protein